MHLGLSSLLEFYREHQTDEALVLATVIAVEGSTYRKPGAMMLIDVDHSYQGLISGGCLEADLASQATRVFADGIPRQVCYDMSHGDDFVWGLGLGCDGIIHLMLQRLDRSAGFGFFESLDQIWLSKTAGLLSIVTSSSDPRFTAGDFGLACGGKNVCGEPRLLSSKHATEGSSFSGGHDMSRRYWQDAIKTVDGRVELLLIPVMPPPSILICGAGHDALPVARQAIELGWSCVIVDHRSGFAKKDRFPAACEIQVIKPEKLSKRVSLDSLDAVILMTHHLGHDRCYLSQVVDAAVPYIGMLGPRARRDRLLGEIGAENTHVHGPAGLDIGAELPESIALAIVAEIHAFLNQRSGEMLSPQSEVN